MLSQSRFWILERCHFLLSPLPGKANIAAIDASSTAYIWPIPSGERAANSLCEPNP